MANDINVVQKAKEIFQDFIHKGTHISANIRRVIYLIVGTHASEQEFDLLIDVGLNPIYHFHFLVYL